MRRQAPDKRLISGTLVVQGETGQQRKCGALGELILRLDHCTTFPRVWSTVEQVKHRWSQRPSCRSRGTAVPSVWRHERGIIDESRDASGPRTQPDSQHAEARS